MSIERDLQNDAVRPWQFPVLTAAARRGRGARLVVHGGEELPGGHPLVHPALDTVDRAAEAEPDPATVEHQSIERKLVLDYAGPQDVRIVGAVVVHLVVVLRLKREIA